MTESDKHDAVLLPRMTNAQRDTLTPADGTIVLDEKGQRYVYRDGEWKPAPEWKDEPSPLDDRRELDARADKVMDDASQVMAEAGKEILKLRAPLPDGETVQIIREALSEAYWAARTDPVRKERLLKAEKWMNQFQ